MRARPLGDYGLLLSLSVIWGGTFSVIKIAVESVGPVSVAAGRIAVAAAILYLAARAAGARLPTVTTIAGRRTWLHFLAVGMLGNGIPFTLISWGETRVSSSLAAILIGVMPVFTAALAKLSGVEARIGARRIIGIALGLAALTVLMGPAVLGEIGGGAAAAQFAVTVAAASYAATAVYAKKLSLTVPTLTLAAGTMIACALVMVPAALLWEPPWHAHPSADSLAAVVALGVLPTALAAIIYFRLLVSAGPTFASMINFLIPAIGTVTGVAWLGEALDTSEAAALALILAAVALVRARPAEKAPA